MSLPYPHGNKTVYLVGAMTKYANAPGDEKWGRRYFEEAAKAWRAAAWTVISPIEEDDRIGGPDEVARLMQKCEDPTILRDLGYVARADAVAALSNWKDSRIGRLEIHYAHVTGKPVYEAETGATLWANAGPDVGTPAELPTVSNTSIPPDMQGETRWNVPMGYRLLEEGERIREGDLVGSPFPDAATDSPNRVWRLTADVGTIHHLARIGYPYIRQVEAVHATPPVHDSVNGETRVVSSTGGAKGQKEERWDLMPPFALRAVATHFGRGAKKYEARNWERGYAWSLCFAAMQRHLWAWWGGETIDPETQSNHMTAAAWHALVLLEFSNTHPEFDDRPGKDKP